MFGWTKKSENKNYDASSNDGNEANNVSNVKAIKVLNDSKEALLVSKVNSAFEESRAVRMSDHDDTGFSIEEIWDDELNIYKGGGLQWQTNLAYRPKKSRQIRPNSEDNFIFNTLTIHNANITTNTPEVTCDGIGDNDNEIAEKITYMSRFNDERNEFASTWEKIVADFTGMGPAIAMVHWDADWMGGTGPERWIGDVRICRIKKHDFYPDCAIDDWEERLDDCGYIIRRLRKKLTYIKQRWDKYGEQVSSEMNDNEKVNEGSNPQMAYVYEYWHRGYPEFVPKERAKELREKALELEQNGDTYKAQDYYDAAKGDLEGVHVAYVANGVLLEYIPYMYEHGKYPFVFVTQYHDENSPWGFGEIRNIKIPQILHNKADEIEIEAMSRQGLGGMFYQKSGINPKQIDNILKNNGRGGMFFEVDNINFMRERNGAVVPPSIINYKEHKERVISTVSQVTPSVQGRAEYANLPYSIFAA